MMSQAEKVPFTEPRVWLQQLDKGLDALVCELPVMSMLLERVATRCDASVELGRSSRGFAGLEGHKVR